MKINNSLKEIEIEKAWSELIISQSPFPVTCNKEKLGIGTTDGIIRFYNDTELLFWILQETKRDVGLNSVWFNRSLLQSIMYLSNIYYDTNPLSLDKFKGVFLDSAKYFVFINKKSINCLMENFYELWSKYYRVRPSDAWRIPDLNDWIQEVNVEKTILNDNSRLKNLIEDIYNNKF